MTTPVSSMFKTPCAPDPPPPAISIEVLFDKYSLPEFMIDKPVTKPVTALASAPLPPPPLITAVVDPK